MALGFEGYIMVGGTYALGTGTSVPRARARLDSSSGYGGRIKTPISEIGIGAPRTYDWEQHDGSVNFELTKELWASVLNPWVFDRQTQREVYFSSRDGNVQQYSNAFWNSISVSADENAVVNGSVGFVAIERTTYAYGVQGTQGYIGNKEGQGLLWGPQCATTLFPRPLNEAVSGLRNIHPIPFWYTKVIVPPATSPMMFISWTLEFTQDVMKFFACMDTGSLADPGPIEPEYLAAGPMAVKFSGTYMFDGVMADTVTEVDLHLANQIFKLKEMQLQSVSDNVQTGGTLVPLDVEYAVYDITQ